MSLPPVIPETNQPDEITLEDAVNLLLQSISMEKISMSKLMDTEQSKVLCAQAQCKCEKGMLFEAPAVNRSVDDIKDTITQLQMLLQFKLKNVQELIPCHNPFPPLPTPCSICSMRGTGKGLIQNKEDAFYHCPASIYTFLPYGDRNNRTVRYRVGDNCNNLYLYACDRNVKMQCHDFGPDPIVAYGEGRIRRCMAQEPEQTGVVSFTLTVSDKELGALAFRMVLTSSTNPCFEHDSGWVKVDCQVSDLHYENL